METDCPAASPYGSSGSGSGKGAGGRFRAEGGGAVGLVKTGSIRIGACPVAGSGFPVAGMRTVGAGDWVGDAERGDTTCGSEGVVAGRAGGAAAGGTAGCVEVGITARGDTTCGPVDGAAGDAEVCGVDGGTGEEAVEVGAAGGVTLFAADGMARIGIGGAGTCGLGACGVGGGVAGEAYGGAMVGIFGGADGLTPGTDAPGGTGGAGPFIGRPRTPMMGREEGVVSCTPGEGSPGSRFGSRTSRCEEGISDVGSVVCGIDGGAYQGALTSGSSIASMDSMDGSGFATEGDAGGSMGFDGVCVNRTPVSETVDVSG